MNALKSLLFIVSAGPEFGLGHLRRMQAVARAYRKGGGQGTIDFYLLGCSPRDLVTLNHDLSDGRLTAGSSDSMAAFCLSRHQDAMMFDLHKKHIGPELFHLSQQLQRSGVLLVAIDNVAIQAEMQANLRWVPSFFKDPAWPDHLDIQYGWDHYLIEKRLETAPLPNKNRLLVLTGGSDAAGLGSIWPQMLEEEIDQPLEIHWVQGPFAKMPHLPINSHHHFYLHKPQIAIDDFINMCDFVLTVYGVTLFEALLYRRWCVAYVPSFLDVGAETADLNQYINLQTSKDARQSVHMLRSNLNNQNGKIEIKKYLKINENGPIKIMKQIECFFSNGVDWK